MDEWHKTAPAEIWIENVPWAAGRRNHVWAGPSNDPGAPYDALHYVRAGVQGEASTGAPTLQTAADLAIALREIMQWISNWTPNFAYDEAWPATEEKARAALLTAARQGL
jgi:hypothetical protein